MPVRNGVLGVPTYDLQVDYGHPVRFGTFLTPANDDPEGVVVRAVLCEQLGYDLVTFQDHPYQPAFLDTWTLLSWVAARTERITLAGNVLNVPMRPAPVLARAAASLDLLSGGRLALGLGAGGFWDPMVAMGVTRRTAWESVDQLGEAIDVIRELWDTSSRQALRYDGRYFQLNGPKRGPAPAHRVPIWLGAYGPRMLQLVGSKADGWLPSLSYLKPGALERGNRIIDEAAVAAGRDPREIRRLLNVPAGKSVEELLQYVLEHGVGTFIISSDHPAELERFAAEVIPPLREAVAGERTVSGVSTGPVRGPAVLARRRDGIDYDGLPGSLAEVAIEPGDQAYARVRSTGVLRGSGRADRLRRGLLLPGPLGRWGGRRRGAGRDRVRTSVREFLDGDVRRVPVSAGRGLGRAGPALHGAVSAVRDGSAPGADRGGLATGVARTTAGAEAALRPGQRLPGQLQHRPVIALQDRADRLTGVNGDRRRPAPASARSSCSHRR